MSRPRFGYLRELELALAIDPPMPNAPSVESLRALRAEFQYPPGR